MQSPLDAVLDALDVGVLVLDRDRVVAAVNQRALELLGIEAADLVGRLLFEDPDWDLVLPNGQPISEANRPSQPALGGQRVRDFVVGFRVKRGERRWSLMGISPITGESGAVERLAIHFTEVVSDINSLRLTQRIREDLERAVAERGAELAAAEQKLERLKAAQSRAELALRQSEELNRGVITAMAEGVVMYAEGGEVLMVNPAAEQILGVTRGQLLQHASHELGWTLVDDQGAVMGPGEYPAEYTARTGKRCRRQRVGILRGEPDAEPAMPPVWLEISTEPLPSSAPGGRCGVIATFSDVTLERAAAAELSHSRARFAAVLQAVPGVLYRYVRGSEHSYFEFISAYVSRLFGLTSEQVVGRADLLFSRIHPEDYEQSLAAFNRAEATLGTMDISMRGLGAAGDWRWLRNRAVPELHPHGVVWSGVLMDITEERKLAEQVRAAQRREAIAEVASGVAHNFNNALGAIIPNLEGVLAEAKPEHRPPLQEALQTAESAAGLVRQLMVVARARPAGELGSADFARVVGDVASLCRGLFPQVNVTGAVGVGHAVVATDADQLRQMVLNLCINARHALEGTVDATLDICLQEETQGGRAGVCLRVADNGQGMSEATRARLGEPFFTTKAPGQGTGLGLATVYAIVRDLEGKVECASELGQGTEFVIWLPTLEQPVGAPAPVPQTPRPEEASGLRILVVDDEPLVRRALVRVLRKNGWFVEEAGDGQEALARVAEAKPAFSVAVIDLSMPGLSGAHVLKHLTETQPELPVLVLSGMVPDPSLLTAAKAVLEKPISGDVLVRAIVKALQK